MGLDAPQRKLREPAKYRFDLLFLQKPALTGGLFVFAVARYVNDARDTAKPGPSHIVIMQDIPRRKTFLRYFLAKFPVACSIACTKGRRDKAKPGR